MSQASVSGRSVAGVACAARDACTRSGASRDEMHKPVAVYASGWSSYNALQISRRPPNHRTAYLALKEAHMSYYCSECVVDWSPYQTENGHCPTCGGTVRRHEPPHDAADVSPLELAETAHMAARLCWLWPNDHEQRTAAIQACDAINVDYIGALAKIMHDTGATAHVARRQLAEALRRAADRIYATDGRVDEWADDGEA